MRAVTEAIECAAARRIGKIDSGEDAFGRHRSARREARVDQSNRDPRTGDAEVPDDRVGAGSGDRHVHRPRHSTVGGNREDAAVGDEIEDLMLPKPAAHTARAASTDVPATAGRQFVDVSGGKPVGKRHDHAKVLFAAIHLVLKVACNLARCGLGGGETHGERRERDQDGELFLHG